jgi:hypothetical protein
MAGSYLYVQIVYTANMPDEEQKSDLDDSGLLLQQDFARTFRMFLHRTIFFNFPFDIYTEPYILE